MKYRIGFVSNSSSASYCLLGFDASEIGDKVYEMIEERQEFDGMRYLFGDESGLKDEQTVVGAMLLWAPSGDYVEPETIDLATKMEEVVATRKKLNLESVPIKLYTGTAMC